VKLDRRQFLEGAAAMATVPLLPSFEPALAASLAVPTTLAKAPVLIPIHGTERFLEAPPWLVRMICGFNLALGESHLTGNWAPMCGPFRAGLRPWPVARVEEAGRAAYRALKIKERILAQSLDEVGLFQEVLMDPVRTHLIYRPRGERLPGLMPYLRCPGKRPLTPEERAELQPLEQEMAELAGNAPPRCDQLR
jgi:hypothetical protein